MKKLLSIILSIAMVLCMMPIATGVAFAEDVALTVSLEGTKIFDFNGQPQAPEVTVTDSSSQPVIFSPEIKYEGTEGTSYGPSATAPSEPGKYIVKANHTENETVYSGSSSAFEIRKIDLGVARLSIPNQPKPASYEALEYSILVGVTTITDNTLSVTGIVYDDESGVGTATITVLEGSKYFNTGTTTSQLFKVINTTDALDVSFDNESDKNVEYTGKPFEPKIIVKNSTGTILTAGQDYSINYSNNIAPGTATIFIVGLNKYTGLENNSLTFTISKKDISKCNIVANTSIYNNGQPVVLNATITNGSMELKEGTDYTLSSSSVGESKKTVKGVMSITGIGAYYGSADVEFSIVDASDISTAAVTVTGVSTATNKGTYDGTTRSVTVTTGSGTTAKTLTSQDYTYSVSYKASSTAAAKTVTTIRDAGTYTITITGKGSYAGTKIYTFTIDQLDLSKASLTATATSSTISSTTKPTIKLKANSLSLTQNTDFTVETVYKKSKSTTAQTATGFPAYVQVKGKSPNFTGEAWVTVSNNDSFSDNATIEFGTTKAYTSSATTVSSGTYINGTKLTARASYYAIPAITVKDNGTTVSNDTYSVKWYYNGYAADTISGRDGFYYVSNSSSYYKSVDPSYFQKDGLYEVVVTSKTGNNTIRRCYSVGGQFDLANCTVTLSSSNTSASATYATRPNVTVKYDNKITLTQGVDYDVTWTDPNGKATTDSTWRTKGSYVATVKPAGTSSYSAFKGSNQATFVFGALTKLSKDNVVCSGLTNSYNIPSGANSITIADPAKGMVVYKGTSVLAANKLTLGTDYKITIVDETTATAKAHTGTSYSVGTYYIKVDFQGAYEGTVYFAFTVHGDPNTITLTGETTYSKYVTSDEFKITAYCTSGGACTFKSSNENVAYVTSSGTVVMGGKVGYALITITSPDSGRYESQSTTVTINVKPKKQVIKTVSSPKKGQLKVQVTKQAGVEKYQIRYSYQSSKVTSKYGTVYSNDIAKYTSTQSKTIKKSKYLKSGKYAYVKVRAVYTKADGTKGYGSWSNVKKIKIK